MRVITMMIVTLVTGVAAIGAWVMLGPGIPAIFSGGGDPAKNITRKRDARRSAPYITLVPAVTLPEKIASAPPAAPSPPAKPEPPQAPAAPPATKPRMAAKPKPAAKPSPIAKQALEALVEERPKREPLPKLKSLIKPRPKPEPLAASNPQTAAQAVPEPKPEPKPEQKHQPASQVKLKPSARAVPQPKTEKKRQPAALVKPKPAAPAATPAPSPPASPASAPAKEPGKSTKKRRQLTYEVETSRQAAEQEKQQSLSAGETVRFRRVIPQGTGRLKADETIIVLADIDSLSAKAKCKYASGKSWDCGRWGKYALRRFIRGRAVVCNLVEEISETEVSGHCKVAGKDINEWVVRRGWGQPSADNATAYAASLSAAKKDKLGLWSDEPKSVPQPRSALQPANTPEAQNQSDPVRSQSNPSNSGR